MPIKNVKVNYVPAVPHHEPVERIPVSASHKQKLGICIRQKCEQNAIERINGEQKAKRLIVR